MKTDRQIQLNGDLPQRVPALVAQQGLPQGLRLAGKQNALVPHGGAAPDFFDRLVHIPERGRGNRQQAARIGRRPLGLPVVIGSDTGQLQLFIVKPQELLAAKPADVGIHDHRPDAHFVHVFEPFLGVIGSGVHLFIAFGPIHHVAHPGRCGQARIGDAPVADEPPQPAFGIGINAGHGILHPLGHPAGPQVGRFRDMGININNGIATHTLPPSAAGPLGAVLGSPRLFDLVFVLYEACPQA